MLHPAKYFSNAGKTVTEPVAITEFWKASGPCFQENDACACSHLPLTFQSMVPASAKKPVTCLTLKYFSRTAIFTLNSNSERFSSSNPFSPKTLCELVFPLLKMYPLFPTEPQKAWVSHSKSHPWLEAMC